MSANFEAKKEVVSEIEEKVKASKSVVFVNYDKMTVAEISELRNKCKEAGCEYKVYKNTLIKLALNDLGTTDFDKDLVGTTAMTFGTVETDAAKLMMDAAKTYGDKITVKCAYVDNTYVDKAGVKDLSKMPSRDELVAKMLGSMQAPIANFAGVLSNLVSGVVRVLDQVAKQKAGA